MWRINSNIPYILPNPLIDVLVRNADSMSTSTNVPLRLANLRRPHTITKQKSNFLSFDISNSSAMRLCEILCVAFLRVKRLDLGGTAGFWEDL